MNLGVSTLRREFDDLSFCETTHTLGAMFHCLQMKALYLSPLWLLFPIQRSLAIGTASLSNDLKSLYKLKGHLFWTVHFY